MPYEEKRTLKRAHRSLVRILWMRRVDFLKVALSKKAYKEMMSEVYGCLKHYPPDYRIGNLYELDKMNTPKEDRWITHGDK